VAPQGIGELHGSLWMAFGGADERVRHIADAATSGLEPVENDHRHGIVRERPDLDEVRLGEEGLGVVGEQHSHGRRLRSGEHDSELAIVVLKLSPQHRCAVVDIGDP
jgi:hypothetical protein